MQVGVVRLHALSFGSMGFGSGSFWRNLGGSEQVIRSSGVEVSTLGADVAVARRAFGRALSS